MSDAGGNDALLFGAMKDFREYWNRTEPSWKDAARRDFERDYLSDLMDTVRGASNAIAQIELLLRQVRKECS